MKNNYLRLGVDLGGTFIKFAVVDNNGIVFNTKIPTNIDSPEALADSIAKEVVILKKEYNFKSVGIGTSGCITDGLVYSDNLRFNGVPLGALLEERLGFPVIVENDANCAAIGELYFANEKNYKNMIYLTIGTGVGGAIIIDGKLFSGKGAAGEIGHMIVQTENGIDCPCGQKGCYEQYASTTALIRMATEKIDTSDDALSVIYRQNGEINGKTFFQALKQGSAIALQVFEEYTDWLASGIVSVINIFDPDVIVLSGGISKDREYILEALHRKVHFNTPIEVSILQNDAGSLGAAMLWEGIDEN